MNKYTQILIVIGMFLLVVFVKNGLSSTEPISISQRSDSLNTENSPLTISPTLVPANQNNLLGKHHDGIYTGDIENAFYGNVQVQIKINQGKIIDLTFLEYPNDNPTTRAVNAEALPILKAEALTAQSANVDIVSTASQTSEAFRESLSSALDKSLSS